MSLPLLWFLFLCSLTDVKDHRKAGDGLLTLMLARMEIFKVLETEHAEQIKTNATLRSFLDSVFGREDATNLACRIYCEADGTAISDEKCGDLVEALIHKTFNLNLLEQIISHGREMPALAAPASAAISF